MKKMFIHRKMTLFITTLILSAIFILNFAGGVGKDGKTPTPTNCDQTTEIDANLFFGAGSNILPF